MTKGMLAVAITRICKGCSLEFRTRKSQQLFHDKACKDNWHAEHRYDKDFGTCKHPDGCSEPARRRGWCFMHYQRIKTTGRPGVAEPIAPPRYEPGQLCAVEGCADPARAAGHCSTHYKRLNATGDVGPARIRGRDLPPGHSRWTRSQKNRYWRYGVDPETYERVLKSQRGRCYVCGTANPGEKGWATDHCHETNVFRFIACFPCNMALGLIKEDPAVAKRLLEVAIECQQLRLA